MTQVQGRKRPEPGLVLVKSVRETELAQTPLAHPKAGCEGGLQHAENDSKSTGIVLGHGREMTLASRNGKEKRALLVGCVNPT